MLLTDHLQNSIDKIETLICPGLSEEAQAALAQAVLSIEFHKNHIIYEELIELEEALK